MTGWSRRGEADRREGVSAAQRELMSEVRLSEVNFGRKDTSLCLQFLSTLVVSYDKNILDYLEYLDLTCWWPWRLVSGTHLVSGGWHFVIM